MPKMIYKLTLVNNWVNKNGQMLIYNFVLGFMHTGYCIIALHFMGIGIELHIKNETNIHRGK